MWGYMTKQQCVKDEKCEQRHRKFKWSNKDNKLRNTKRMTMCQLIFFLFNAQLYLQWKPSCPIIQSWTDEQHSRGIMTTRIYNEHLSILVDTITPSVLRNAFGLQHSGILWVHLYLGVLGSYCVAVYVYGGAWFTAPVFLTRRRCCEGKRGEYGYKQIYKAPDL